MRGVYGIEGSVLKLSISPLHSFNTLPSWTSLWSDPMGARRRRAKALRRRGPDGPQGNFVARAEVTSLCRAGGGCQREEVFGPMFGDPGQLELTARRAGRP